MSMCKKVSTHILRESFYHHGVLHQPKTEADEHKRYLHWVTELHKIEVYILSFGSACMGLSLAGESACTTHPTMYLIFMVFNEY